MNKTSITIAAVGLTICLSGCSLLKKNNATTNTGDAMPLYPVTTAPKSVTGINGHWFVSTVGTITLNGIEDDEWPYIDFVADEARFYGSDGCNIINGSYRTGEQQTLTLSKVATTMRLCEGDTLAYPIANALNSVAGYSVSRQDDGREVLNLYNSRNLTVMTLRKSSIDFINGAWQVTAINGEEVKTDSARLIFDVNENTITGNAGCNRLMGEISRNPQVTNSVQFSGLATTRMICPDIATESALLIALEEVVSAKDLGKNTIAMVDGSGKIIIKLKKLQKSDF